MRIIARRTLRAFWERHPDAEQALRAWYADARRSEWNSPQDIRNTYVSASIIANNRVVFNIRGNTYRLIVADQLSLTHRLYSLHWYPRRL